MSDTNTYAVILVHSVTYALKAEKLLEQTAIPYKLIPVPRHLSSQCGVCMRILQEDREQVIQLLHKAQLDIVGIHEM